MHDQNAATVVTRLWIKWITRQGCPLNILSDQGDNVDGDTIREICDKFTIKKQRTSGYHREGNGFAERNICTIRELFRSLLLDFEVPQNQWNEILPGIIFALNTSISSATKCTPYKVLYGRLAILPIDIILGTNSNSINTSTPQEYLKDLGIQLRDILLKVNDNLKISRQRMIEQYNRNGMFYGPMIRYG